MPYLAHWARKLFLEGDCAQLLHYLGEGLPGGVEYVVQWGLLNIAPRVDPGHRRRRDPVRARARTPDAGLLDRGALHPLGSWVGKERTTESFQQFFTLIGKELAE